MSVMSTISFPNPHSPTHQDSPVSATSQNRPSNHIDFFPPSYDPQASASSFQINPLSMHPPRTPRTSIVTAPVASYTYNSTEENEVIMDSSEAIEEDEVQLEERMGKRVRKEEVWREVLATSKGRDKALKLIQYSLRVFLLFHTGMRRSAQSAGRPTWEIEALQRIDSTISGLSLTRKCLILFNWLAPLSTITAPQSLPFATASKFRDTQKQLPKQPLLHKFLHAPPPVLLDLLNSFADDVATFSRLGLIGKKVGTRAARLADWCWFSGTLVGLVEVGVEQGVVKNMMDEAESRLYAASFSGDGGPIMSSNSRLMKEEEKELEKLKKQYYWLRVSRFKLIMDLIFVSYDCFKLQRGRRIAMPATGLLSAALSSMKLYDEFRTNLVKSLTV